MWRIEFYGAAGESVLERTLTSGDKRTLIRESPLLRLSVSS